MCPSKPLNGAIIDRTTDSTTALSQRASPPRLCRKLFRLARMPHIRGRSDVLRTAAGQRQAFEGRQFIGEVILWAVRWYLSFPTSYRDLEMMAMDRGVEVDHTTIFRWIQAYAGELEKRIRRCVKLNNGSWRVDETDLKVKGRWTYLYRGVDSQGQTIDFLLSAKRDAEAAKRFFRKALSQPHTVNPRTITVDESPAFPKAVTVMKGDGELWRHTRLRRVKYLNNIVEQDHRRIKRLTRARTGFGRRDERWRAMRRWR